MSFIIILCTIVLLFLLLSCYRQFKGRRAELKVHRILSCLPNEYYFLEDITLEHNGYTTQIDHIIISPYGIFIIETKGYHGWILGGEKKNIGLNVFMVTNTSFTIRFYKTKDIFVI